MNVGDRLLKGLLVANALLLIALLVLQWVAPPMVQISSSGAQTTTPQAYLSTQTVVGALIVGLFSGIIGSLCTGHFTRVGQVAAYEAMREKVLKEQEEIAKAVKQGQINASTSLREELVKEQRALTQAVKEGQVAAYNALREEILEEQRETTQAIKQVEADIAFKRYLAEAQIAYREKQLAEFYGPIYGSVKLTGKLWKLWMAGQLGPISTEVQQMFRDQNKEIMQILKTKFYLVEGNKIPPSFSRYLTSVTLFNIGTVIGGGHNPPEIAKLPEASFPQEFFDEIVGTTQKLKAELEQLYREHRFLQAQAAEVSARGS